MIYEIYRLSLVPKTQMSLFDEKAEPRRDVLNRIFGNKHSFSHYKREFVYVPNPQQFRNRDVLIGRVGKKLEGLAHRGPEDYLTEYTESRWTAAELFINVTDSPKHGQVVAFERTADIGKPQAILSSFIRYLNERGEGRGYDLFLGATVPSSEFWSAMERHSKKDLTKLSFHLFAPNILKAGGTTKEMMEKFNNDEGAEDIRLDLNGSPGRLNAFTDTVRSLAEYALAGAGEIIAKAGKRVLFSSKDEARTIEIDKKAAPAIIDRARAFAGQPEE